MTTNMTEAKVQYYNYIDLVLETTWKPLTNFIQSSETKPDWIMYILDNGWLITQVMIVNKIEWFLSKQWPLSDQEYTYNWKL